MGFSPELLILMNQRVKIRHLESFDLYGEPTYSTESKEYSARVSYQPHRVSDWEGNEYIAQASIIIATADDIFVTDQLELPSGETPLMINLRQVRRADNNLVHHWAVSVGGRRERRGVQ